MKYIKEYFGLEPVSTTSFILKAAAAIFLYKFIKGLIKELKFRSWLKNASQEDLDAYHKYLTKKMEPTEFKILANKIDSFFRTNKKIKVSEDYGYITFILDDLTIKISKLRKTITWNHIRSITLKTDKEFIEPIKITDEEILDLKKALEDDKENEETDLNNFINTKTIKENWTTNITGDYNIKYNNGNQENIEISDFVMEVKDFITKNLENIHDIRIGNMSQDAFIEFNNPDINYLRLHYESNIVFYVRFVDRKGQYDDVDINEKEYNYLKNFFRDVNLKLRKSEQNPNSIRLKMLGADKYNL